MTELREARPADLDPVFELLAARSRAAFGISELDRRFVAQSWSLDGTDTWVADDGAAIVGYAELQSSRHLEVAARDPDVGDALLAQVESRARARGFDSVTCTVVPEDAPLQSLVERSGFEHDRDVLRMWRALDGDQPEPTVAARAYRDEDAERVHAFLDAAYASWDANYVRRPHADWLRWMTKHDEFDRALWFLVERDDELVACALHWKPVQRRGWVKDIAVSEASRGLGLAKGLLHHGFRAAAARGADRVGLKVDSTNPTGALQLYERTGFVTDRRFGIWQKRL